MKRHVVLVGLPGAGKSTAGRLAAAELEAAFRDLDDDIARNAGMPVPGIFAERGEGAFRALEREAMEEALAAAPHVIAPGGGWAAQEGVLEAAAARALSVHLRVSPQTAARRLGDAADRPLLAGRPRERLAALAASRAPFYRQAEASVDTEGHSPPEVAAAVAQLARSRGGW